MSTVWCYSKVDGCRDGLEETTENLERRRQETRKTTNQRRASTNKENPRQGKGAREEIEEKVQAKQQRLNGKWRKFRVSFELVTRIYASRWYQQHSNFPTEMHPIH